MINEVKIGDMVSFRHNKKQVTGKVIHRHIDKEKAFLAGHVNVQIDGGSSYPVTVHVSKLKPAVTEEYHMDNIRENIEALLDSIESGNNIEANEIFDNLLQQRINELMDAAKVELSQTLFDTSECAECDEEMMGEAKKMKDGKDAEEDEEDEDLDEALKGKQHKIDANKNGKIDAQDFKMLRAKKGVKEEVELDEVEHPKYSQSGDDALRKARKVIPGVNRLHAARKSKMYGTLARIAKHQSSPKHKDHSSHPDDKQRDATLARTATTASKRFARIAKGKSPFQKEDMNLGEAHPQTPKTKPGAKVDLAKGPSLRDKLRDPKFRDQYKKDMNKRYGLKEEAEQIDEYQKGLFRPPTGFTKKGMEKGGGVKTTLHYGKKSGSEPVGATMRLGRTEVPMGQTPPKPTRRKKPLNNSFNPDMEQMDEVITKSTPTGEVIKDFVHSKNPKFKGKSKKERIKMALGAKYGMMKKGKKGK